MLSLFSKNIIFLQKPEGSDEKTADTPMEKRKAASTSNARSRRAMRHRHQACDDSESEDDDYQIRESSRIQKGKDCMRQRFAKTPEIIFFFYILR